MTRFDEIRSRDALYSSADADLEGRLPQLVDDRRWLVELVLHLRTALLAISVGSEEPGIRHISDEALRPFTVATQGVK